MPVRTQRWTRINTDRMAPEFDSAKRPLKDNVPRLDGSPLSLHEHSRGWWRASGVCTGSCSTTATLCSPPPRCASWPGAGQIRVSRHEGLRGSSCVKLHHWRHLRDGADRSIQLEQLGRPRCRPATRWTSRTKNRSSGPCSGPSAWRWNGATPFFTARASSDALILSPGREIEGAWRSRASISSCACSRNSTRRISSNRWRLSRGRFTPIGPRVRPLPRCGRVEEGDLAGPPADEAFVAPALDLAEAIRSRAIRTEDGSAAWIAPQYLVQAERYQLQPIDFNLYGGTCGVALFLAAAERFAPESGYGELALAALRPLQARWTAVRIVSPG